MGQREIFFGPQLIVYPNQRMMSRFSRTFIGVAIVWGVVSALAFLWFGVIPWLLVVTALICALFAGYYRRLALSGQVTLSIDRQGVTLTNRLGMTLTFAWSEIANIAVAGNYRQKLALHVKPQPPRTFWRRTHTFSFPPAFLDRPARELLELVYTGYRQELNHHHVQVIF